MANPKHRLHQNAARAVLKSLLPDSGSNIKGHMRSGTELLQASGYERRLRDFRELIQILDSEIRLITPTDPEGKDFGDNLSLVPQTCEVYYQLTHDYLVAPLRDWLTRKQKETRRGRAELRLQDISATWNSRPESRFLPSWWDNLLFRFMTNKTRWTEPQRKMMAKSARLHGLGPLLR